MNSEKFLPTFSDQVTFLNTLTKFKNYLDKAVNNFQNDAIIAPQMLVNGLNDVLNDYVNKSQFSTKQISQVIGLAIMLYSKNDDTKNAEIINKCVNIFANKQHDYGPHNIARFSELGLVVRLADKVERLNNLIDKQASNESIDDTYIDIINYCAILLLVINNEWFIPCTHYKFIENN